MNTPPRLSSLTSPLCSVRQTPEGGFVLEVSEGRAGGYRVAQLDDYRTLPRARFCWRQPATLSLRARISTAHHPGTWGFGLWNDPFSLSLGLGGMARRLPALPNAAWFFFASPENHLSFRNDQPAQGFLAQVFSAPRVPSLLLGAAAAGLPLLAFRRSSMWLRAICGRLIREESAALDVDSASWHTFRIGWGEAGVDFAVDGGRVFHSGIRPGGPLGIVIWIDNQFAAWKPDGRVGAGTLANRQARLEVEQLEMTQ